MNPRRLHKDTISSMVALSYASLIGTTLGEAFSDAVEDILKSVEGTREVRNLEVTDDWKACISIGLLMEKIKKRLKADLLRDNMILKIEDFACSQYNYVRFSAPVTGQRNYSMNEG